MFRDVNLQARGVLGTNATYCSGRLVLNWCTFQAWSHSLVAQLENGVKRCFAISLLALFRCTKELLIVPWKVDNT